MKHIGRKLYHLLGGIGLLSLYYLLGRQNALVCYGLLITVVLAVDFTRLRVPAFNRFIQARFSSFIRKNEENKLTGTAPYVLGIGLTLLLYRTDIAAAAICFLAFGDVAATAVGERYGRTKISGEKSLEGTLAFVAAAVTLLADVVRAFGAGPIVVGKPIGLGRTFRAAGPVPSLGAEVAAATVASSFSLWR
jgi:dolichol kinase